MSDLELRTIQSHERDAVLDLLAHWFGERDAAMRAFFARYFDHDPTFRDDLCFVATDSGRMVCTLQVFRKRVRVHDAVVEVGGIGNVLTLPEYRERRIASELLLQAVAAMEAHGFDLSLLFAVRLPFYTRLGWQSHIRHLVYVEGSAATATRRYTIAPFIATDLDAVMQIYEHYNARLSGSTVRDHAYWRGQLRYAGNPQEDFLIARSGTTPIAYARATPLYGFYVVMEHGYAPGHEDALTELICALQARNTTAPAGMITQLAIAPTVQEQLRARGLTLRTVEDVFWMWRIIAPTQLAAKLGLDPTEIDSDDIFLRLLPPERSVYWTADRF
jgi:predicted N-acetyltransferase YhbS